ncbi:site-2 protease family protein [Myxococcota bacterium]|nr:site-2 protease family protein [Myxococcota bacterium]MBU1535737.1 site-2 protease family protein [Myxococcota bacterium]
MKLFVFVGLLISIAFHEFGHAFIAHKLGDPTPESQGRVTLNPAVHWDIIGTIILPAVLLFSGSTFFVGWGKPVEIQPRYFTRKVSMSLGDTLVSIAGPIMNVLLAIAFTILFGILVRNMTLNPTNIKILYGIQTWVYLNLVLAVFNMLPIPPLDGGHVLMNHLGHRQQGFKDFLANYGMYIFLALWIFGGPILRPIFKPVYLLGDYMIALAMP